MSRLFARGKTLSSLRADGRGKRLRRIPSAGEAGDEKFQISAFPAVVSEKRWPAWAWAWAWAWACAAWPER